MGIQSDIRDHLLSQPASFKKKKEYQIEELLGRGGFGKVLRATWTPVGSEKRDVALKIINKRLVKDNDSVKDEINVLEGLDHPNIVHVWDHFESRDKYYIAFELAVGGELFDRISSRGRFTEKDAMECIRQVLLATAYLHQHRIVHRDLKPENIIYKTKDQGSPLVVADFGIAKHLSEEGEEGEEIFNAAGSFGYAAPEVLLGRGHGMKVDCWSIGVIAYTLLCGYSPFRSDDKGELIKETTKGKIQFHERYWRKVSQTAKDFIKAMLQVDPKKRLSAEEALKHPWLLNCEATEHDLAPTIKENFTAKKRWNKAFMAIQAANRIRSASSSATNTPTLPSLPSPSVSPSTSTASTSISPTTIYPTTPSTGGLLYVPHSPTNTHTGGASGTLTPLSMSEEEAEDGFVTADEHGEGIEVVGEEEVRNGTSRSNGILNGVDVETEDRRSAQRHGSLGGPEQENEKATDNGLAAGGLKGMMGRLGLGRASI